MKCLRLLPLSLAALLLGGCATLTQQDRNVLAAHQVPPNVFDKMSNGDPLSLDDVIALSRRSVPSGLIIHYMSAQDSVYILRKQDVARLRSAGVSEQVISYMLSTRPPYWQNGTGPYVGYPYAAPAAYPWGPYPYGYDGYYDGYYPGPVLFVGNYGGGWWRGGARDWHGGGGRGGHGGRHR